MIIGNNNAADYHDPSRMFTLKSAHTYEKHDASHSYLVFKRYKHKNIS